MTRSTKQTILTFVATLTLIAVATLAAGLAFTTPAAAQLLAGGGLPGDLGGLAGPLVGPVGGGTPVVGGLAGGSAGQPVGDVFSNLDGMRLTEGIAPATLLDLRRERFRALVESHRAVLDTGEAGEPVRRGEVVLVDPAPATLAAARAAGFSVTRESRIDGLGLDYVVLAPPHGKRAAAELKRLRALAPGAVLGLDPVYEPAGAGLGGGGGPPAPAVHGGATIGMIDGGVAAHPALAGAAIEQRGFAPGGPRASGHGTAIASLLVGSQGAFAGAARGHGLLVADVFGGDPAAGSAENIARALGWLAERRVKVVTISLVGPANPLIERAVAAVRAQGILVVAAAGNDGPDAPPQYPASYAGVVAVTGVDRHNQALPEAGRPSHLDFAAPGADMAAALPGGGYGAVRGTSFAAPLVAARLAAAGGDGPAAMRAADAEAVPGKGKVGRGVLCAACRVAPRDVGAKK